jgi:hypothetical protein
MCHFPENLNAERYIMKRKDVNLKIYLVERERGSKSFFNYFNKIYDLSSPKKHFITKEPREADIILFVDVKGENFYEELRMHPLVCHYPEKCFVFCEADDVIPFLPGIYTSAKKSLFNFGRLRNYCYLSRFTYSQNSFITTKSESKDLLFSFMGGSTSFVRKRLYKINFNRNDALIKDTSYYQHWNYNQESRAEMQQIYTDICARSHFVICPRGAGSGSIRLFEMMEMGIVPVIISDNYLLPEGPRWEEFVVFIKENDIESIPQILEQHVANVEAMGKMARKAWKDWFAPAKQFNNIIDGCWGMKKKRLIPERIFHLSWGLLIAQTFVTTALRNMLRNTVLRAFKLLRIKFPYNLSRD